MTQASLTEKLTRLKKEEKKQSRLLIESGGALRNPEKENRLSEISKEIKRIENQILPDGPSITSEGSRFLGRNNPR